MLEKTKEKSHLFSNLKYVLSTIHQQEKGFLFLNIISVFISAIYSFIPAYALKIIIDNLNVSKENMTSQLIQTTIIQIAILLGVGLVCLIIRSAIDNLSWSRVVRLRLKINILLNDKTLKLDYQTLENPQTLDMVEKAKSALGSNWNGFEGMYNYTKNLLVNLISSVIACGIIFTAHFSIIILVVSVVIVKYFLKDRVYKKDKKEFWDKVIPFRRKLNYINNISNNFSISKDLRIYNMGAFIEKQQVDVQKDVHQLLIHSKKRIFKLDSVLIVISIIQDLAMYAILIWQVSIGNISAGLFTMMLTSVQKLSNQLTYFFSNLAEVQNCSRQVNDLQKVMNFDDVYQKNKLPLNNIEACTIEFKHVYYKYLGAEDFTLKDITFILKPHEKLALVGYNGAGKTTLIKLMMGLYHPTQGEILINGKNVENYSQEDYYKVFAPVFQESNCFNFNIGENVAMKFDKDVAIEKVTQALMLAGLMEKVNTLPKKMQTILLKELDEDGIELSGGELQKLALARAIYKDAPVVILDEPTSALDALAEYQMYHNFNQIISKSSAVYISHRLSSTHFCDRIILLKDGQILEMGTHEELMKNKKDYYELFSLQAKYYKGGDENNA